MSKRKSGGADKKAAKLAKVCDAVTDTASASHPAAEFFYIHKVTAWCFACSESFQSFTLLSSEHLD